MTRCCANQLLVCSYKVAAVEKTCFFGNFRNIKICGHQKSASPDCSYMSDMLLAASPVDIVKSPCKGRIAHTAHLRKRCDLRILRRMDVDILRNSCYIHHRPSIFCNSQKFCNVQNKRIRFHGKAVFLSR